MGAIWLLTLSSLFNVRLLPAGLLLLYQYLIQIPMSLKQEEKVMTKSNVWAVLIFLVVAGITRALPHPPNFTPLAAMALFGGAYLTNRKLAFLLPLVAIMFSDLLLESLYQLGLREYSGLHSTMFFVYGSFIAITAIGTLLMNRVKPFHLLGASLGASVLFFLVTNFGVYATGALGHDTTSLMATYALGIPFFHYTVLGDLFFVTMLFGGFELLKTRIPALSPVPTKK